MEAPVNALTEHETFIREFIAQYKQQTVLWNRKHPHYRNRSERTEAYDVLLKKCKQYYPDADEDFVRMKIDSMRSTFRKERRKVLASREKTDNPDLIYKPSLWYYDLLLFTAGEEGDENWEDKEKEEPYMNGEHNLAKITFWNREHSALMIEFYKNHPCLYSTSHPHYRNKMKRREAIKKITNNLIATTGKFFGAENVRRKVTLLRGQFLYEHKKIRRSSTESGKTYKPTLWCYEMLSFLKDHCRSKTDYEKQIQSSNLRRKMRKRKSSSDDSDEFLLDDVKKESDSSSSETFHVEFEPIKANETDQHNDIFDTIASNVAHKLRGMTDEQKKIAEKIVCEIMYHGQMESLNDKTRLSLDGT